MDKIEVKHRRKLNAEQLEVLELLHKFRFGSNDLFAQYFGKKDRSFVYKRLSILLEQGLVGKRFDSSYRIQGKPAAYYLTPAGARALQLHEPKKPINIKSIYKDKTVKDDFVRHCMDIFRMYNWLRLQHGERLKFFTKAYLNHEQFDYFPQPLPDAYIRLRLGGEEKQYFMDFYYDKQPFLAAVKKIKKYVEYAEGGDWDDTGTTLPVFIAACESSSLQKRLHKRIAAAMNESWADELVFATTDKTRLPSNAADVWRRVDNSDNLLPLHGL